MNAAPLRPPAEWFRDPKLKGPTPLQVLDTGRVYGHVAAWNTCHEGFSGRCVTAPRSRTAYRKFHNGDLELADGSSLRVGKLTLAAGHASTRPLSEAQVRAHYDNTATVAAFVKAGEDDHGIWVAGALKSDLAPELRRDLRANPLSGDWRNGEMVAAHAVIDPGFPILVASGLGGLLDETDGPGWIAVRGENGWVEITDPALIAASRAEEVVKRRLGSLRPAARTRPRPHAVAPLRRPRAVTPDEEIEAFHRRLGL